MAHHTVISLHKKVEAEGTGSLRSEEHCSSSAQAFRACKPPIDFPRELARQAKAKD